VTSKRETYMTVIGACPFEWDWWGYVLERNVPEEFGAPESEYADWSITLSEVDENYKVIADYTVDHSVIMRGARRAMVLKEKFSKEFCQDCARLVFGHDVDEIDFDANTADVILQFGLFGELRYA
jgi:hypothetical protein